jgi:hypothetical protein
LGSTILETLVRAAAMVVVVLRLLLSLVVCFVAFAALAWVIAGYMFLHIMFLSTLLLAYALFRFHDLMACVFL